MQNYLNTSLKRCKITESEEQEMLPKPAEIVKDHRRPRKYKCHEYLAKVWPIIDIKKINKKMIYGSFSAAKKI